MHPALPFVQRALALATCALLAPLAQAAGTISIVQVGPDVVATGSGSFNTQALSPFLGGSSTAAFQASSAGLLIGGDPAVPSGVSFYRFIAGPAAFGVGSVVTASSASGDLFGTLNGMYLMLPVGYVSGSQVAGSATWAGTSITGLGLTEGTYVYTWGSGSTADSMTVQISAAVPEPATALLALGGLAALAAAARRRRG